MQNNIYQYSCEKNYGMTVNALEFDFILYIFAIFLTDIQMLFAAGLSSGDNFQANLTRGIEVSESGKIQSILNCFLNR